MAHDARSEADSEFNETNDNKMADDNRATYRSWKKKYRKMRVVFDQRMHHGEELYKLEQKALATARRLAVEKDRLLDLLLDVNNSAQIPPEKRFDLSLDVEHEDDALTIDLQRPSTPPPGPRPKSYQQLLRDVPHYDFASAAKQSPELLADLEAGHDSPAADPSQSQQHPPSFLTADDIDNYLWQIDSRLLARQAAAARSARSAAESDTDAPAAAKTPKLPELLPTLAPLAHIHDHSLGSGAVTNGSAKDTLGPSSASANRDFALRNPTSVYNWLRKHAPKTFLQDGEHGTADKENGDDHGHGTGAGAGRGRGGSRGGGDRGRGGASTRGKRKSVGAAAAAAAAAAHARDADADTMDEDTAYDYGTPSSVGGREGGGKGKRKRMADDDAGYRPKGGSSRPTKKKRKSEGDTEGTPSGGGKRGGRKSGGATARAEY